MRSERLALTALVLLSACVGVTVDVTPVGPVPATMKPREPQAVKLFEIRPDDGVEVYEIEAYGDARRTLLAAVREKAANLGCDGVMITTSRQAAPTDADATTGKLNQRGRQPGPHVDALCIVIHELTPEERAAQALAERAQATRPAGAVAPAVFEDDTPLWTRDRKIAAGFAGASVLALAAGSWLGLDAQDRGDEAHQACPNLSLPCKDAARANELFGERNNRALGANIAFGMSAVFAIGAGILWFTGAPETQSGHIVVAPTLAPGEAGVTARVRF